jgi:hypothetical protein
MADDLKVQKASTQSVNPIGKPGQATLDPQEVKLARLQAKAIERGAGDISVSDLKKLVQKSEAKLEKRAELSQTKSEYDKGNAKEKLVAPDLRRQQAGLMAGAMREVSAAGESLDAKTHQRVASDPDAPVTLPPLGPSQKPTDVDTAKKLLRILSAPLSSPDGEAFDFQNYAKSLRKKPPMPPSEQSTNAALSSRPSSVKPKPRSSSMPQRGSAAVSGLGARPMASSLSLGGRSQTTSNSGGSVAGQNRGGAFSGDTSFDGMNFNWDAFTVRFLIDSQKNQHEWKRALKEMRETEFLSELSARDLDIKMREFRNRFEKLTSLLKVADSGIKLQDGFQKGAATGVSDLAVPGSFEDIKPLDEKIEKRIDALGEDSQSKFRGASNLQYLDPKTIDDPELKSLVQKRNQVAGVFGEIIQIEQDLAQPNLDDKTKDSLSTLLEEKKEVLSSINDRAAKNTQIRDAFRSKRGTWAKDLGSIQDERAKLLGQSDLSAADADKLKTLNTQVYTVSGNIEMMDESIAQGSPLKKEDEETLNGAVKKEDPDSFMVKNVALEDMYLTMRKQAVEKHRGNTGDPIPYDKNDDSLKGADQLELPIRILNDENSKPEAKQKAAALIDIMEGRPEQAQRSLNAEIGGKMKIRLEREIELSLSEMVSGWRPVLGISAYDAFERALTDAGDALQKEGDQMMGRSLAAAVKGRKQSDAMLRKAVAQGQGMINQLIQVLAMSRSR